MELYASPPPDSTVICADELGPVIPRTFPPAPGWSPGGHRVKAPLEYSRGPDKTWACGGLRIRDGQAVTMCAPSRNSEHYQRFLQQAEDANPEGAIYVVTDNLSSHDSKATRAWLEDHPRIRHAFIPMRCSAFLGQESGGYFRLLPGYSGTHPGLPAVSCIPVPSGDASYYTEARSIAQYLLAPSSGKHRLCGARARPSVTH